MAGHFEPPTRPRTWSARSSRGCSIEHLEIRRLLASSVSIQPIPAIPRDLVEKIDARLWTAAQSARMGRHNELFSQKLARLDSAGRIELYVRSGADPAAIRAGLESLGGTIKESIADMHTADVIISPAQVGRIARLAGVTAVTLPDYAVVNTVTSAGDSLLKADKVRSAFAAAGIDGTGIKVGVISDGATHLADVGNELPDVTIDPVHPGSGDEGTAMLEIVHDLAPGSQLCFSGPNNSAAMVSAIGWLVGQGCNVICDDLSFFGESWFSDSTVANAAASAVAAGVVYVTSAGNYNSNQHYQAQYVQSTSNFQSGLLHRFKLSPADDSNGVTIPAGAKFTAYLQWSDPWGSSGNNYDLYLMDSSTLKTLGQSTSIQNGNDFPWEALSWTNNGSTARQAEIWINKKTAAASRELELFTFGNSSIQYSTASDQLIGQEAVSDVISVAAANASSPNAVAYYSSRGGSTIYTNFASQTKTIRQSLDGTAIDGVQTAIGQQGYFYNPFYGTSAASPHTGAIAALILQANPTLTPVQVSQIMADTATDLGTPGYDINAGAGLFNALDAVYKVFTPAAPDLPSASDTGVSDTDNLTMISSPSFTGSVPAGSFVRLYVDGVESNNVQLGANVTTFSLQPGLPMSDGIHSISIRIASSASVPLANGSNPSPVLSITIDTAPPQLLSSGFNFNAQQQNITFTFDSSVAGTVQNTDLCLNGSIHGAIPSGNIIVASAPATDAVFTFNNYPYHALPDGTYIATIAAADITDQAGNPLTAPIVLNFFYLGGDFNHDGLVNADDLGVLAINWNTSPRTFIQGDASYDGRIDIEDLKVIASHWQMDLFAYELPVSTPAVEPAAAQQAMTPAPTIAIASPAIPLGAPPPRRATDLLTESDSMESHASLVEAI